jgi:DNA invertase Pin-like site-specific DNA recombinase
MIEKTKLVKAVSYVRVSGTKQVKNGNGLENQKVNNRNQAEARGHEIVKTFEDKAVSITTGRDNKVPDEFKKMKEYCEENNIKAVYIFSLCRSCRTVIEAEEFFIWAMNNKIDIILSGQSFVFQTSNGVLSAHERLTLSVLSMVVTFENTVREERVNYGRDKAKKERRCGRRKSVDREEIKRILDLNPEYSLSTVAKLAGCSKQSVVNVKKELQAF